MNYVSAATTDSHLELFINTAELSPLPCFLSLFLAILWCHKQVIFIQYSELYWRDLCSHLHCRWLAWVHASGLCSQELTHGLFLGPAGNSLGFGCREVGLVLAMWLKVVVGCRLESRVKGILGSCFYSENVSIYQFLIQAMDKKAGSLFLQPNVVKYK